MRTRLASATAALLLLCAPLAAPAHPSAEHQVERFDAAIRAQPDDPTNYLLRGALYSNEARYDEALADLRKAELLGDPVIAAYELGVLHYRTRKLAEARRYFDRFLQRFPEHARALEYRARVRRDSGDTQGALADFRAHFALTPRPNPGDYLSAAQLLAGAKGEDSADALAMLDEGMQRLGVIPQLQQPAIAWERARGNLPAAIARLETLAPSLGKSPDWKVDKAELLLAAGKRDEAKQQLAAASDQLATLPTTKAREKLRERLRALEAAAAHRSTDSSAVAK